jgi:hypothetical protein
MTRITDCPSTWLKSVYTLQSMTNWSRSGLRILAELDALLVSRWQGPVDSPATFVQRITAIRGERGKILRHSECWHRASLPSGLFPGQLRRPDTREAHDSAYQHGATVRQPNVKMQMRRRPSVPRSERGGESGPHFAKCEQSGHCGSTRTQGIEGHPWVAGSPRCSGQRGRCQMACWRTSRFPNMSRMAIPVVPWLAVCLLTFLPYRQRELLQAELAGAALLLCLGGFHGFRMSEHL